MYIIINALTSVLKKIRHRETLLFILVLIIQLFFLGYLLFQPRIISGHDGFMSLSLQYYFLNNAVTAHEIPHWIPFMTHGVIPCFFNGLAGGILQNILVLTGSLFKHVNFLTIFHWGIFVDELILLTGVWLLARRFFSSSFTVFFVAASVMGSCIWMSQPGFNFHFYYAIPLILHYGHVFLDSQKWRYALLAGNLLALQILGDYAYLLPVIALVIFLYFLFYYAMNHKEVNRQITALPFNKHFWICLLLLILSFGSVYHFLDFGTDRMAFYRGENISGTITLKEFMQHGGPLAPGKWLELLFGISPFLDYTLYLGVLAVPLIFAGLWNLGRRNLHFLLLIGVLLLFSMGTWVAPFFYHVWPMMKLYRHIGFIAPIIKLFLVFLAGFGFEAVFMRSSRRIGERLYSILLIGITLSMTGVAVWLFCLSNNYDFFIKYIAGLEHSLPNLGTFELSKDFARNIMAGISRRQDLGGESLLAHHLGRSALLALVSSLLLGLLFMKKLQRYRMHIIGGALILQLFDIYGYKLSELNLRTTPVDDKQQTLTSFQAMPYAKMREDKLFWRNSFRASTIMSLLPFKHVEKHWTLSAFLFKDQDTYPLRTDFWLMPLDNYMRAYSGQSIHDVAVPPRVKQGRGLVFPLQHPAAGKIAGMTLDKIQFFSDIILVDNDDEIVSKITAPQYTGDMLFISPREGIDAKKFIGMNPYANQSLSSDYRMQVPYRIEKFDSNNLEVAVDIPGREHAWMLYSDVWDPLWKAAVNGKPVPVFKANLAYKAIPLPPGENHVRFSFHSNRMTFLYWIFGMNSLVWIILVVILAGRILSARQAQGQETIKDMYPFLITLMAALIIGFAVSRLPRKGPSTGAVDQRIEYLQNFSDGEEGEGGFQKEVFFKGARMYKKLSRYSLFQTLSNSNRGFCHFYLGNYREAIELYKAVIQIEPRFYSYNYDLGFIFYSLENVSPAIMFLENSLQELPKRKAYYMQSAMQFLRSGQRGPATEFSYLVNRANQDEELLYAYLADCYFQMRDYKEMHKKALWGMQHYPQNPEFIIKNGILYFMARDYKKAVELFHAAALLKPQHEDIEYYREQSLQMLKQGKTEEAAITALKKRIIQRETERTKRDLVEPGRLHFYGGKTKEFFRRYTSIGFH